MGTKSQTKNMPIAIRNCQCNGDTHKYQETCAVGGFLGLLKHALQKAFYSLNFLSASLRQTKPHRKFPIKKVVTWASEFKRLGWLNSARFLMSATFSSKNWFHHHGWYKQAGFKGLGKNLCTRQALDQGLVLNILQAFFNNRERNLLLKKNVEFLEFFGFTLLRKFQAK